MFHCCCFCCKLAGALCHPIELASNNSFIYAKRTLMPFYCHNGIEIKLLSILIAIELTKHLIVLNKLYSKDASRLYTLHSLRLIFMCFWLLLSVQHCHIWCIVFKIFLNNCQEGIRNGLRYEMNRWEYVRCIAKSQIFRFNITERIHLDRENYAKAEGKKPNDGSGFFDSRREKRSESQIGPLVCRSLATRRRKVCLQDTDPWPLGSNDRYFHIFPSSCPDCIRKTRRHRRLYHFCAIFMSIGMIVVSWAFLAIQSVLTIVMCMCLPSNTLYNAIIWSLHAARMSFCHRRYCPRRGLTVFRLFVVPYSIVYAIVF